MHQKHKHNPAEIKCTLYLRIHLIVWGHLHPWKNTNSLTYTTKSKEEKKGNCYITLKIWAVQKPLYGVDPFLFIVHTFSSLRIFFFFFTFLGCGILLFLTINVPSGVSPTYFWQQYLLLLLFIVHSVLPNLLSNSPFEFANSPKMGQICTKTNHNSFFLIRNSRGIR